MILKQKILVFLSYVLVAVLATASTLGMVYLDGDLAPTKLEQLEGLIQERFIGEADPEKLEDAAAAAMVAATGDKWSYYISASEYEAYAEQMANAYVGVGITIQKQEGNVGFLILAVNAGGPAEEAGLQPEDLLIRVADTDVRELAVEEVRNLVRGEEGTFGYDSAAQGRIHDLLRGTAEGSDPGCHLGNAGARHRPGDNRKL